MKNQQLTTALLALVLPILGACSNPDTLETNTVLTPKTLQSQAAANIVPNAVWQATHTFQLRAYYNQSGYTFAANQNGVSVKVQYTYADSFNSAKLQFEPGAQANTLTSSAFYYVANATAKISGLPNCTYSLGQQQFSVPANSITLTFDPTHNPDPNDPFQANIPKDWIYTDATNGMEVVSVDTNLQSVCQGPSRGQTTTTQTPVTLFRTTQPADPIIRWYNYDNTWNKFANPNLQDIAFGTFPSGGLHLWH